jgi:aminoglycoside phosphotransferase (APT) family kinase protein
MMPLSILNDRIADVWLNEYPDPERHEVICHNDFAPYNFVYSAGIPYAVIDFDLAGPGPRLKDLAYALYWMVPLSFNSGDQVDFAEADVTQRQPSLPTILRHIRHSR